MTSVVLMVMSLLTTGFSSPKVVADPVQWSFSSQKVANNEFILYFDATVTDGWYIYSQNMDEGGPVPTSFSFKEVKGSKLAGKVEEEGKMEQKFDDVFEMNIKYYKSKVRFKQKVVLTASNATIKGDLMFMVCDSKQCLPPKKVPYNFNL